MTISTIPTTSGPSARGAALAATLGLLLAFASPAVAGDKPGTSKGAPAKPAPAKAASLEEVIKAGDRALFDAVSAYVRSNGAAKDVEEARKMLVDLAEKLEDWGKVVSTTDEFLAAHAASKQKVMVSVSRAQALAKQDKAADAKAAYLAITKDMKIDVDGPQAMWSVWSEYATLLVDTGDVEGAKKAYAAAKTAIPHPQVAQIADAAIKSLDVIGKEPAAFPEAAKDADDKAISLKDYAGKVLLIDFWATWCPPCRAEMPNVVAAYEKFHGQGFEIVGVSLDEPGNGAAVKTFTSGHGMTWRQILDNEHESAIAKAYGVESIPHTVLIGKDGKVARVGARGKALDDAVAKLIAAK